MKFALAAALLFLGLGSGCTDKVPLTENHGHFDMLAAHWFENEKTEYVFFSVDDLRPGQARLDWPSQFEIATGGVTAAGLVPTADGYSVLDLSKGVHQHHLVSCGEKKICGSFSFRSDSPPPSLKLRFRYHKDAALTLDSDVDTSVHPASGGPEAHSALVYGVFSADNRRVQLRVHDNFGYPDSEQIRDFGLERSFEIRNLTLTQLPESAEGDLHASAGTPFLFPATTCDALVANVERGDVGKFQFRERSAWHPVALPADEEKNVACFRARLVDQKGQANFEASALARRNPVVEASPLQIHTPLQSAKKIPIVISYCLNQPDAANYTSSIFLDYQRFILGIGSSGIDTCFAPGLDDWFKKDLSRVVKKKLEEAKSAASETGDTTDFFFTVVINHALAREITTFHEIIGQTLAQTISEERARVSPRLVGAFVYDSQSADVRPVALKSAGIIWCPRDEKKVGASSSDSKDINCTPFAGGNVALGPIKFLLPMGPFPTLDAYVAYVKEHGSDHGQSLSPELSVSSIHTNENSVTLPNTDPSGFSVYTFFDGQRLSLKAGEKVIFCQEHDDSHLLDSAVFRTNVPDKGPVVLNVDEAQAYQLQTAGPLNFDVGLGWEYPFLGTFSYESPLEGRVFGLIPLSKNFKDQRNVGDPKWLRTTWDFVHLIQKCTRNCSHPYFDEAGVYQIDQHWAEQGSCVTAKIPEPAQ